jgi:antitoxin VapB
MKNESEHDHASPEAPDNPSGPRAAGLAERLLRIGEECAADLEEPYRSVDHGELLYGEDGIPID